MAAYDAFHALESFQNGRIERNRGDLRRFEAILNTVLVIPSDSEQISPHPASDGHVMLSCGLGVGQKPLNC